MEIALNSDTASLSRIVCSSAQTDRSKASSRLAKATDDKVVLPRTVVGVVNAAQPSILVGDDLDGQSESATLVAANLGVVSAVTIGATHEKGLEQ